MKGSLSQNELWVVIYTNMDVAIDTERIKLIKDVHFVA